MSNLEGNENIKPEVFDESSTANDTQSRLAYLQPSKQSLSLFDIIIRASPAEKQQKTDYEENLAKEEKDWLNLLNEMGRDVIRAQTEGRKIDKNVLTIRQRSYLESMPDLQKFVEESNEFCLKANEYLHANEEIVKLYDQLTELCQGGLDKIASDVIYNCIYEH